MQKSRGEKKAAWGHNQQQKKIHAEVPYMKLLENE